RRDGSIAQNIFKDYGGSRAREGMLAGNHLIEHCAAREKVRAGIELFTARLFWRHIGDGADGEAGTREMSRVEILNNGFGVVAWNKFGEAEVENFCLAAVSDKDVSGLDIAMNDAFFVGGVERVGYLDSDFERGFYRLRASANDLIERFAF